jgi:hypothetical protein
MIPSEAANSLGNQRPGLTKLTEIGFGSFVSSRSSIRRLQEGNGEANTLLTICRSRVQAVERPSVAAAASKLCELRSAGIALGPQLAYQIPKDWPTFHYFRSVIPKNRQRRRPARCSERNLPENRCHSPYGTSKALKIFRKSSRKGIAAANRISLKTPVVTKTARVFQKVWV